MNIWKTQDCVDKLREWQTQGRLKQWRVEAQDVERKEIYLIQSGSETEVDQARSVNQTILHVSLWVKKDEGKQGMARQQLFSNQSLDDQLSTILEEAKLSTEKAWQLPEEFVANTTSQAPQTQDQAIGKSVESAALKLTKDFEQAIKETQGGEFNSAELFVTKESNQFWLSNGGEWQTERSRVYSEVCFSQTDPATVKADEYLLTDSACAVNQVNFPVMCKESADNARDMLQVELTPSSDYAVLVSADVIAHLFNDVLWQLSGARKYFKMPFIEEGSEFIPGFKGESFDWWLDPSLPLAIGSCERDIYGRLQERTLLVKDNKVQTNLVDDRISQYLDHPPTTTRGNLIIEASGKSLEDLRKSAPKVLEVEQFSALFSSSQTLTYSSEIRLGRLHDNENNRVIPVKGGNLSGNFKENFSNVKWSKEQTIKNIYDSFAPLIQAYKGPKYALINDVKVSS